MDPVELMIRQRFPQMIWALEHPELGPLLRQAVAEGWDPPRLQGELLKTGWYRNTADAERNWDRLTAEDPASQLTQFLQSHQKVVMMAQRLGVTLSKEDENALALAAARSQWQDQQLTIELMRRATFKGEGVAQGQINSVIDQIKQTANDYFAPIADQQAFEMGRKILTGEMDQGSLESYFKDLAVARFQGNDQIVQMLDRGFNAAQIFAPYVQQTAQLLELAPANVNLLDPKFSQILDYADANGNTRPMTLTEAAQFVRGTNEYKGTAGAVSQAADFAEFIGQRMGAVA